MTLKFKENKKSIPHRGTPRSNISNRYYYTTGAEGVSLLPELNEKQTIKNVKRFFEKDFPKLQNMAHTSFVDMKSPVISDMPLLHGVNNSNEDKFTAHAQAKDLLAKVLQSCSGLDKEHQHVLELRCFKKLSWTAIEDRTGYSNTRNWEQFNEALLQFSWAFADVEDLRVFKDK